MIRKIIQIYEKKLKPRLKDVPKNGLSKSKPSTRPSWTSVKQNQKRAAKPLAEKHLFRL